jgi:hypothetical protein
MTEPDFRADRIFLHLSDIHFRKGSAGDPHDSDADLRNELERDLRILSNDARLPKIDGIIVSGDIAFGGQKEEFEIAKGWLETVRELIDSPADSIMVTPGNHDVDRALVVPAGPIDVMHEEIRAAAGLAARDDAIARVLRDAAKGPEIFSSIAAYNEFANGYSCGVTPGRPYWERDFGLGHGGMLRIRG